MHICIYRDIDMFVCDVFWLSICSMASYLQATAEQSRAMDQEVKVTILETKAKNISGGFL